MRHFVKLLIVLSCIICWAGMAQAYTWYPYNGHSYALIDDRLTWVDAEQAAVGQGAHLVTINDLAEQNWLVSQFGSGGSYWIGLYQLPGSVEPDQGFVWVSGEPVTFTNWAPLEPNNLGDEMYVAMNEHAAGWWNDLPQVWTVGGAIMEIAPIPGALVLLGSGLALLAACGRRQKMS